MWLDIQTHMSTFESLQFKSLYVEDYCIYYNVLRNFIKNI